jgi:hypothetical protein
MANAARRLWPSDLSHEFRAMALSLARPGIKGGRFAEEGYWCLDYGQMLPELPLSSTDETIRMISRAAGVGLLGAAYLMVGLIIFS